MLNTDVTGEFLAKFQKLFKQFVKPERTWIYQTPCDCGIYPWPEEEEEDDE